MCFWVIWLGSMNLWWNNSQGVQQFNQILSLKLVDIDRKGWFVFNKWSGWHPSKLHWLVGKQPPIMMNLAWNRIKANQLALHEFLPTFNESWGHNWTIINFRNNFHISWSHKQTRDPRHVGFTLGCLYRFPFSKGNIHLLQDT